MVAQLTFIEQIGHHKLNRQREGLAQERGTLQVDDDRRVRDQDIHKVSIYR